MKLVKFYKDALDNPIMATDDDFRFSCEGMMSIEGCFDYLRNHGVFYTPHSIYFWLGEDAVINNFDDALDYNEQAHKEV